MLWPVRPCADGKRCRWRRVGGDGGQVIRGATGRCTSAGGPSAGAGGVGGGALGGAALSGLGVGGGGGSGAVAVSCGSIGPVSSGQTGGAVRSRGGANRS